MKDGGESNLAENARERSRKPLIDRGEMNDRFRQLSGKRLYRVGSWTSLGSLSLSNHMRFCGKISGKFLSKLPGERSKSGSKAGNRKLENPDSSRIFILGFPRLTLVGALPKLDVAGSTPVARSTISLNRIS
jgi:hypothetical protein